MPKTLLTFEEVMKRIADTLKGAEGSYIADIHNKICDSDIKYLEDSLWTLKEEPEEKKEDGDDSKI